MKMTDDEKRELVLLARKAPKSRWAYFIFVWPLIMLLLGAVVHASLLIWLHSHALEIFLAKDGHMERVFDSADVRGTVLVTSFSVVAAFGLLTLLASVNYRQARLLRKAASDMGLIE